MWYNFYMKNLSLPAILILEGPTKSTFTISDRYRCWSLSSKKKKKKMSQYKNLINSFFGKKFIDPPNQSWEKSCRFVRFYSNSRFLIQRYSDTSNMVQGPIFCRSSSLFHHSIIFKEKYFLKRLIILQLKWNIFLSNWKSLTKFHCSSTNIKFGMYWFWIVLICVLESVCLSLEKK